MANIWKKKQQTSGAKDRRLWAGAAKSSSSHTLTDCAVGEEGRALAVPASKHRIRRSYLRPRLRTHTLLRTS